MKDMKGSLFLDRQNRYIGQWLDRRQDDYTTIQVYIRSSFTLVKE